MSAEAGIVRGGAIMTALLQRLLHQGAAVGCGALDIEPASSRSRSSSRFSSFKASPTVTSTSAAARDGARAAKAIRHGRRGAVPAGLGRA